MRRSRVRAFVLAVGLVVTRLPGATPFPFAEATIDDLQARMAAGELTALALTNAYLERIAAIDQAGPSLRAVLEINPDALAIAAARDAERAAGKVRGPLHGIPVLLKDNIATADRMQTTAGSLANLNTRPPHDASIVQRLRDAGAVILGKTNLSEWANFRGERSSSGWSARGGQTRNPYVLDRSPSGSSSGSAVAVAANLCVAAIGTETDGSVVSPAAHCGIVGLKPTVGLVSRTGIIPISVSQDTAGPMTRTVRDAALILAAIAGMDPADEATAELPPDLSLEFVAGLLPDALHGARLGILRDAIDLNPRGQAILEAAIGAMRAAGAEILDPVPVPDIDPINVAEWDVLCYEFKDGINAWFAHLGPSAPVQSLTDLIAFNESHRAQELQFFGQETLVIAQAKGSRSDPAYLEARTRARRIAREEGIDRLMNEHRLEAIVVITAGPAWLIDPVNGDAFTGESSTLAAVAGCPSITVPAGFDAGLPIGISFTGRAWSEARLLALAAAFEAWTAVRREPRFLPTVELRSPAR